MAFTKDCTNMPMSPDKLLVQSITICLLFLYDHQDLHEEKTSHFSYIVDAALMWANSMSIYQSVILSSWNQVKWYSHGQYP